MKYYYVKTKKGFVQDLMPSHNPMEFVVESSAIPTETEIQAKYLSFMNARSKAMSDSRVSELRSKRDEFLSDSDWTQATDSPLSAELKTKWMEYRQALRELPNSNKTNWPIAPPTK
jgi:hypothetical protein